MKLSTLLISASALLTASIATTATASSPTTQQADGKQDFWQVICHDPNTHRVVLNGIYDDRSTAEMDLGLCEFFGWNGSMAKVRR